MQIGPTDPVGATGPLKPAGPVKSKPVEPLGPDQIKISENVQYISELLKLPEIRIDLINQIKAQLEAGQFESDEKLLQALEKIIERRVI